MSLSIIRQYRPDAFSGMDDSVIIPVAGLDDAIAALESLRGKLSNRESPMFVIAEFASDDGDNKYLTVASSATANIAISQALGELSGYVDGDDDLGGPDSMQGYYIVSLHLAKR